MFVCWLLLCIYGCVCVFVVEKAKGFGWLLDEWSFGGSRFSLLFLPFSSLSLTLSLSLFSLLPIFIRLQGILNFSYLIWKVSLSLSLVDDNFHLFFINFHHFLEYSRAECADRGVL